MANFRIREICKDRGLPLKDLATAIGTSRSSMSQILANPNPSIPMLEKIAAALDVEVADLFVRTGKSGVGPAVRGCIVVDGKNYEISNKEDIEEVLETIKSMK